MGIRFICVIAATLLAFGVRANADLVLVNGTFDDDPDLGAADDPVTPPSFWFAHYTEPQSWSDFRFGNDANGDWENNAITFARTSSAIPSFPVRRMGTITRPWAPTRARSACRSTAPSTTA